LNNCFGFGHNFVVVVVDSPDCWVDKIGKIEWAFVGVVVVDHHHSIQEKCCSCLLNIFFEKLKIEREG